MNPSFIADIKRIHQAIFHEATAFICLAWRIKKSNNQFEPFCKEWNRHI